MNTRIINSKLFSKLKDKKYRNLFIAGEIKRTIPFQMRALRGARGMSQADLATAAETQQSVISRIENRGAANLSIKTLLKLAEVFDVALVVRFEPIDNLIDWVDRLSPDVMSPNTSEDVIRQLEERIDNKNKLISQASTPVALAAVDSTSTPSGSLQTERGHTPEQMAFTFKFMKLVPTKTPAPKTKIKRRAGDINSGSTSSQLVLTQVTPVDSSHKQIAS